MRKKGGEKEGKEERRGRRERRKEENAGTCKQKGRRQGIECREERGGSLWRLLSATYGRAGIPIHPYSSEAL